MAIRENIITLEAEQEKRIDKLLADRFLKSRTYFQYLIEEGCVLKNGQKIKKSDKAKVNDEIDILFRLTPEIDLQPENIPLNILFEDEHILVVNKPAGLVVHPAPGNWSGTFVNALLYHCQQANKLPGQDLLRPGIVHRLDKDTTGLLIAAKTEEAHRKLIELFSERAIYKEYLTIAVGVIASQTAIFPIGRDPFARKKMTVREEGKLAETDFSLIAANGELSLVSAILKTGRTHQIRVHLRHLNTPILGDDIYGFAKANQNHQVHRPLLHAYKLKLKHPIFKTEMEFQAPLPDDIKKFIYKIDSKSKLLD